MIYFFFEGYCCALSFSKRTMVIRKYMFGTRKYDTIQGGSAIRTAGSGPLAVPTIPYNLEASPLSNIPGMHSPQRASKGGGRFNSQIKVVCLRAARNAIFVDSSEIYAEWNRPHRRPNRNKHRRRFAFITAERMRALCQN